VIAAAVAALVLLIAGIALARSAERRRAFEQAVVLRLSFPQGLEPESVTAFLAGLAGLLRPREVRWLRPAVIAFEVSATHEGIEHRLVVPERWTHEVQVLLRTHLPSVGIWPIESTTVLPTVAAEYTQTSGIRPLRAEAEALSSVLLSSLQPLHRNEQVTVQWIVTPHGPIPPADELLRSLGHSRPTAEQTATLKRKLGSPQLLAVARIGSQAAEVGRARVLVRRAEVALHGTRAPGVHLKRRSIPASTIGRRIAARAVPFSAWPLMLGADELVGLLGWPLGRSHVAGMTLGGHRELPTTRAVPRAGTVLGVSTYPGDDRPIAVDLDGRVRHMHLMGPTGSGKSTLMAGAIAQDLAAGRGVAVIDPKGDLVADVLALVPESRHGDVIVLDPADDKRPVGLNPLRSVHGSREVAVENLVSLFRSLYKSWWGPRTDDILRAALQTLALVPDTTLCEVPLLLNDPSFRRRLVGSLDDPIGLEAFWGWYESISDSERLQVQAPLMNKLRAFTMRPRVRQIVGQARPALDFSEALASGKIVLVSLASGLLGAEAANLLGALVLAELWHAATARAGIPASKRRPFMVYVDEAQRTMHLPTSMADAFAEARGFGLSLTIAHQHLGQLPTEMREAVLANARTRLVFQLGASDARVMAKELGGGLTPEDLEGLGQYEFAAQVFADGQRQPPLTGRALPPADPVSDGDALRAVSRERFGVDRSDVERSIRERQGGPMLQSEAVGTRSRRSGGTS
jgi:hypothetical protein